MFHDVFGGYLWDGDVIKEIGISKIARQLWNLSKAGHNLVADSQVVRDE